MRTKNTALPKKEEICRILNINAIRLISIDGIMDRRNNEVYEYLEGCDMAIVWGLLEKFRNEKCDDPEWKEANEKLALRLSDTIE